MNARRPIDESAGPRANHVAFNNDRQYFSVALDGGFSIYISETCELYMEQEQEEKVRMAVMLESSQIVGLLKERSHANRSGDRLALWDSEKRQEVAAVTTTTSILGVRLTKLHIALVFERSVALYRHQPKLEKIATYETTRNALGLCCLGARTLVLPGRSAGQIQLLDLADRNINIIPAHATGLRALELSPNDEIIASASDRGTLIRLHSTSTCGRIAEMRRGVTPAVIYSLAISPSSSRLAVTSDTNTLHIFDLPGGAPDSRKDSSASGESGWQKVDQSPARAGNAEAGGFLKWGSLASLPFTPRIFTDVYSFASATFDPGKEGENPESSSGLTEYHAMNITDQRPPKGVAGWIDDQTVAVVSSGSDARYERFALAQDAAEKTVCIRVGRSRYMVPN